MNYYEILCEANKLGINYINLAIAQNMLDAMETYEDEFDFENCFLHEKAFDSACYMAEEVYLSLEEPVDFYIICRATISLLVEKGWGITKKDIINKVLIYL